MTFVIAITKDRQPRSFRFQVRPGFAQPGVAQSRAVADAAKARRDAERVFGPAKWERPENHGVTEDYVVWVALYQTLEEIT
jgi:hypothetical protein